jgi:hypothetical protein
MMPMISCQKIRVIFFVFVTMLLVGCSVTALKPRPPTGWVGPMQYNQNNTYIYSDGTYYQGAREGNLPHGIGRLYFSTYKGSREYAERRLPAEVDGSLSGEFINGSLAPNSVATYVSKNFTYHGGYNKGFEGEGKLLLENGVQIKGRFQNQPTLSWTMLLDDKLGATTLFFTNNLIGSRVSGPGTISWPDGTELEGVIFDYYPFERTSPSTNADHHCFVYALVGKGVLKQKGVVIYEGFVGDNGGAPQRRTKSEIDNYIEDIASCDERLEAGRSSVRKKQNQYAAELDRGRARAQRMLMTDLAAVNAQTSSELNKIASRTPSALPSAASRGNAAPQDEETQRTETRKSASKSTSSNASASEVKRQPEVTRNKLAESKTDLPGAQASIAQRELEADAQPTDARKSAYKSEVSRSSAKEVKKPTAETRSIVTEATTDMCYGRSQALDLAHTIAKNDADKECRELGGGWKFQKKEFDGYTQCSPCSSSKEFRCTVKQAVYSCIKNN